MDADVLIIGGGLSGLAVADALQAHGVEYRLVEARPRFGGRILSANEPNARAAFDLGPAWFWPGQRRIAALAQRLGADVFRQYATGRTVFEDRDGQVRSDLDIALNPDAFRVDGGLTRVIEGLVAGLDRRRLTLNAATQRLTKTAQGWRAEFAGAAAPIDTKAVVLAAPPRVVAKTITFAPSLTEDQTAAMRAIPTWMAGHAKAVITYEHPFWREAGLSGDAISHRGPLAQIHDASPADAAIGALFGFIGLDPLMRRERREDQLRRSIEEQLGALFSPIAARPKAVLLQDWAQEPFTATSADATPPTSHPRYHPPRALAELRSEGLHFAVTEMAEQDGGLLEGALAAAEATTAALTGAAAPAV